MQGDCKGLGDRKGRGWCRQAGMRGDRTCLGDRKGLGWRRRRAGMLPGDRKGLGDR
jgi:hypothetical protein